MPRTLALSLAAAAAGVALAAVLAFAGPAARTSADPNLDSEEQTFVTLINNYRAQNGLGPLSIDWEMQASADWMSTDMGINGYFDHYDHCTGDCVNGHQYSASVSRSPWTRMCTFGYCYNTWMAENIAAGYSTAQGVFTAWQNSPGHNANMLGAHYIAMGIARVYVPGSPYGWYWTNDFGGVQSNAAGPAGGNGATNTPSSTPSPAPTVHAFASANRHTVADTRTDLSARERPRRRRLQHRERAVHGHRPRQGLRDQRLAS